MMPQTRSKPTQQTVILTDTVCVGDRSYSMMSTDGGSQEGGVEYMRTQRDSVNDSDIICGNHVQYVSFDTIDEVIYSGDAKDISDMDLDNVYNNMKPRNGTMLYDTIHKYLTQQMSRVDNTVKGLSKEVNALIKDNKALVGLSFAIITDGKDNASTKTSEDCKILFKRYKDEYGGTAMFIAANQDAVVSARQLGIDENNALQMGNDRDSSINAAKAVSFAQCRMVSGSLGCGDGRGETFTALERQMSDRCQGSTNVVHSNGNVASSNGPCMTGGGLGGGEGRDYACQPENLPVGNGIYFDDTDSDEGDVGKVAQHSIPTLSRS
jgi:hypothetical protein